MNLQDAKPLGVYLDEMPTGPGLVPFDSTALPTFIGYTQLATANGHSLVNTPTQVSSMAEYQQYFGGAPATQYQLLPAPPKPTPQEAQRCFSTPAGQFMVGPAQDPPCRLYAAIRHYFLNGGGPAYIVSSGSYTSPRRQHLLDALNVAMGDKTLHANLLLIPDALSLPIADYNVVQQQILLAASQQQDFFAILDIHSGDQGLDTTVIADFRDGVGTIGLSYAAAYYPWLNTSVFEADEFSLASIAPSPTATTALKGITPASPEYPAILEAIACRANILPPGPAIAGNYYQMDTMQGIWVAPANTSISAVISTTVPVSDSQQSDLYIDQVAGKSINPIRSFPGIGPAIIWGARTLDSNSADQRYIPVVRTYIMIEEFIKQTLWSYVFSPNTAPTWIDVRTTVENGLNGLWAQGALQGATPSEAYSVAIGESTTMTTQDVLNGIMRLTASIALMHPAEFRIITCEQQMAST